MIPTLASMFQRPCTDACPWYQHAYIPTLILAVSSLLHVDDKCSAVHMLPILIRYQELVWFDYTITSYDNTSVALGRQLNYIRHTLF